MPSVNIIHTEFAAKLRNVGISQAAFARICGVTTIAVNHWCKGRRAVPRWAWGIAMALTDIPAEHIIAYPSLAWHEVLNVNANCSITEASAARSRLAKKYHPDVGGSVDAMQRINEAFEAAKRLRR